MSPEQKAKISETLKRKGIKPPSRKEMKFTEEQKAKLRGRQTWNKNKTGIYSLETIEKMKKAKIGHIPWNKGLKMPQISGENHYLWIKDRTQIKKQLERNNPNDKQWKYAVYKRDNFKCKIENLDCKGRIEAHHILSWRDYPELRYIINNGITLCQAHHPKRRAEEKRLVPIFQGLVSVSRV